MYRIAEVCRTKKDTSLRRKDVRVQKVSQRWWESCPAGRAGVAWKPSARGNALSSFDRSCRELCSEPPSDSGGVSCLLALFGV